MELDAGEENMEEEKGGEKEEEKGEEKEDEKKDKKKEDASNKKSEGEKEAGNQRNKRKRVEEKKGGVQGSQEEKGREEGEESSRERRSKRKKVEIEADVAHPRKGEKKKEVEGKENRNVRKGSQKEVESKENEKEVVVEKGGESDVVHPKRKEITKEKGRGNGEESVATPSKSEEKKEEEKEDEEESEEEEDILEVKVMKPVDNNFVFTDSCYLARTRNKMIEIPEDPINNQSDDVCAFDKLPSHLKIPGSNTNEIVVAFHPRQFAAPSVTFFFYFDCEV